MPNFINPMIADIDWVTFENGMITEDFNHCVVFYKRENVFYFQDETNQTPSNFFYQKNVNWIIDTLKMKKYCFMCDLDVEERHIK